MSTIVIDVDGVLADFTLGFTMLGKELGVCEPVSSTEQPTWGILRGKESGIIWREIEKRSWWWYDLEPLVSESTFCQISDLQDSNQVVFCTARYVGVPHVQSQTTEWLYTMGIRSPNVICTKYKGDVARILGADYCIDDKVENANCVHWIADQKPCRSYLLDRAYNGEGRARNVRVVFSLSEFLEDVKNAR